MVSSQSPEPRSARGKFIVLDGVDGCGKTTQALRLVDALARSSKARPLHLREPGSTELGERLRDVLLSPGRDIDPGAEALIFAAARRQMLREKVEPALREGRDVVCERFHPSTFAYQAVAGGLDERELLDLLESWAGAPRPDVVVLIEIDPKTAASRRSSEPDRIEAKGLEFQARVAGGYRRYAALVPQTAIVDGSRAPDAVAQSILEVVTRVRA